MAPAAQHQLVHQKWQPTFDAKERGEVSGERDRQQVGRQPAMAALTAGANGECNRAVKSVSVSSGPTESDTVCSLLTTCLPSLAMAKSR